MQFEEVGLIEVEFGLSCSPGNWAEVRSFGRPRFEVCLLYRVIFLSCWIKNSYCGQENKARSLREPAFESPMSDVYSNVFVKN